MRIVESFLGNPPFGKNKVVDNEKVFSTKRLFYYQVCKANLLLIKDDYPRGDVLYV